MRCRAEMEEPERHEEVLALSRRALEGWVTLLYVTRGGDTHSQAPLLR